MTFAHAKFREMALNRVLHGQYIAGNDHKYTKRTSQEANMLYQHLQLQEQRQRDAERRAENHRKLADAQRQPQPRKRRLLAKLRAGMDELD